MLSHIVGENTNNQFVLLVFSPTIIHAPSELVITVFLCL